LNVGDYSSNTVFRFDGFTGATLSSTNAGGNPRGITAGVDGNIYVARDRNDLQIVRFDGETGESLGVFAEHPNLTTANDLVFGPDGNLYVASFGSDEVLRFDGQTGSFLDVFASGPELAEPFGLAFGSNGNLYVSTGNTGLCGGPFCNAVLEYNGVTGGFIGVFVSSGAGGLNDPLDIEFGPDGNLYARTVIPTGTLEAIPAILRFDGTTGIFIDQFVTGDSLGDSFSGFDFGPDGNLYVANKARNQTNTTGQGILRFDGKTGAFIDVFVPSTPQFVSGLFIEFQELPTMSVATALVSGPLREDGFGGLEVFDLDGDAIPDEGALIGVRRGHAQHYSYDIGVTNLGSVGSLSGVGFLDALPYGFAFDPDGEAFADTGSISGTCSDGFCDGIVADAGCPVTASETVVLKRIRLHSLVIEADGLNPDASCTTRVYVVTTAAPGSTTVFEPRLCTVASNADGSKLMAPTPLNSGVTAIQDETGNLLFGPFGTINLKTIGCR